jgi:hypothetical protein
MSELLFQFDIDQLVLNFIFFISEPFKGFYMITKIMVYFNFVRKSAISEVAKKVIILTQRYVPIRVQKQKSQT